MRLLRFGLPHIISTAKFLLDQTFDPNRKRVTHQNSLGFEVPFGGGKERSGVVRLGQWQHCANIKKGFDRTREWLGHLVSGGEELTCCIPAPITGTIQPLWTAHCDSHNSQDITCPVIWAQVFIFDSNGDISIFAWHYVSGLVEQVTKSECHRELVMWKFQIEATLRYSMILDLWQNLRPDQLRMQ